MKNETLYEVTVKRIDRQQYEEMNTFYLGEDKVEYTYSSSVEKRTKHSEPTGKLLWSEETTDVYRQKVSELDIKKLIEAVN